MTIAINDAIAPAVRQDIQLRLENLAADEGVRMLMAVESGSRAWGFPSPDSDYDVRFLYAHSRDRYLQLQPGRDVIERPIVDEIDLSGWDVRKALMLLLKSNAVISEWIESPIRYQADHPIIDKLRVLADDVLDPRALAHHYASLGRNAADRWLGGDDDVPVKKYFYALRPALAIRCLRHNPALRPPMNLQALVAASDIPDALARDIAVLVEAKSRTNERANGARMPALDALIGDELARASDVPGRSQPDDCHRARADQLFLEIVNA